MEGVGGCPRFPLMFLQGLLVPNDLDDRADGVGLLVGTGHVNIVAACGLERRSTSLSLSFSHCHEVFEIGSVAAPGLRAQQCLGSPHRSHWR